MLQSKILACQNWDVKKRLFTLQVTLIVARLLLQQANGKFISGMAIQVVNGDRLLAIILVHKDDDIATDCRTAT